MIEGLQKSCSTLESKAEDYLKKLKEGREEQATLEEQLRKELAQQVWLQIHHQFYRLVLPFLYI
jgi:predicted nuclease with TOPRIM domain